MKHLGRFCLLFLLSPLLLLPKAEVRGKTLPETVFARLPEIVFEGDGFAEEETDSSLKWELYAVCTITHYCPCVKCCGKEDGITASERPAVSGRTVAMESLPFGTEVLIGDNVYVVEDRGVYGNWVDIYCDTHEEALCRGIYEAPVYVKILKGG